MTLIKTDLPDLYVVKPTVHEDERGVFFEAFKKSEFEESGIALKLFQTNISISKKNVVRGMHFQNPPFEQGKLVRVPVGAALDVVIDIRKNSSSYGKHYSIELNEENKLGLWVPPGFAHGFAALEDDTMLQYGCTNEYNKEAEGAIHWNDPEIGIKWGIENPVVSEKDAKAQLFADFESQF